MLEFTPILVSLKLSLITTILLFIGSFPLAFFLAVSKNRARHIIDLVITLPMVLPPTVLGFYLLILLSPNHYPGKLLKDIFELQLVFTFPGLVIAAMIYSLPFMVRSLKGGIESVDCSLIEAAYTLGKSRLKTVFTIILPLMKGALFTGLSTSFAHTMGCFGVVLMVGGNIPGLTKTASIAIYEKVEQMEYQAAHIYSLILIIISFFVLGSVQFFNTRKQRQN